MDKKMIALEMNDPIDEVDGFQPEDVGRALELMGVDFAQLLTKLTEAKLDSLSKSIGATALALQVAQLERELREKEVRIEKLEDLLDQNSDQILRVDTLSWEFEQKPKRKLTGLQVSKALNRALATDPEHSGDNFFIATPGCKCDGCIKYD